MTALILPGLGSKAVLGYAPARVVRFSSKDGTARAFYGKSSVDLISLIGGGVDRQEDMKEGPLQLLNGPNPKPLTIAILASRW